MGFVRFVGAQFAKPEGVFGKAATFLMSRMNRAQYRGVERALEPVVKGRILDIGFGGGQLLGELARKKPGCTFYGIDISEDMLVAAKKRNKRHIESGRMSLCTGTVENMPYGDACVEGAYTVNTVYFWQDPVACFREIFRVLTPGGRFANAFYSKEWLENLPYTMYGFRKYTLQELEYLARKAGFRKLYLEEVRKNTAYCLVLEKGREQ